MNGLDSLADKPQFLLATAGAAGLGLAALGWFVASALQAGAAEYTSRYQSNETFTRPLRPTLGEQLLFMPAATFVTLKLVCAGLGLLFGLFLGSYLAGFQKLLPILMFCAPAYFIPDIGRAKAREARMKKFNVQLIDALRSISYSMRSGLTFNDAVQHIAQNMAEPISVEFGLVYNEWRMNLTMEQAMENLCKRMPLEDLRLFVASFATVYSVGARLREICERNMQMIQQRLQVEEKIGSMTAEGRLQSYILAGAPFFLVVVLFFVDETLVRPLLTTFTGVILLFVALVLDVVGFLVIRSITNIKV